MRKLATSLVLACYSAIAVTGEVLPEPAPSGSSVHKLARSARATLEVPAGWRVSDQAELAALSSEYRAGTGQPSVRYELFATARRGGSGAVIAVLTRAPGLWPSNMLAKVTEQELRNVGIQMGKEGRGRPTPSAMGLLVDDPEYRLLDIQNGPEVARALWLSYRQDETRQGIRGRPFRWYTHHYYIPRNGYELEVLMAFYEPEAELWAPVMRRALSTLRY